MQLVWAGVALPDTAQAAQSHFAVCVEESRIIAVGDYARLRAQYPQAEVFGGEGLLMLPAFINSHDHGRALGSASLGTPDDLLEVWLPMLGAQPNLSPYLAALYEGVQLLRSGVGTVAHSHNPRDWENMEWEARETLRGYREAGIRVAFYPPIIDQHPLVYGDEASLFNGLPSTLEGIAREAAAPVPISADDYFRLYDALMREYHDNEGHTVHVQVSPAGGQWCSDALILEAVRFAQAHGTRVQMHMLETRYQALYAERTWGMSFIRHLDEIGALGEWLTLAHMVYADEDDFALLADRGVGVAHNPSSNLRLRSGIAPVAAMREAGVRLGIGLDGHGLDDDQDYLRELRLARTLGNRPGAASPSLSSDAVLHMGTAAGAAITLGGNVPLGKLVPGALADLILTDWDKVRGGWSPADYPALEDTADFLLYRAARQHVAHVMVNGAWVVKDGRSTRADEIALADAIRDELAPQMDSMRKRRDELAALAPYLRRYYAEWEKEVVAL